MGVGVEVPRYHGWVWPGDCDDAVAEYLGGPESCPSAQRVEVRVEEHELPLVAAAQVGQAHPRTHSRRDGAPVSAAGFVGLFGKPEETRIDKPKSARPEVDRDRLAGEDTFIAARRDEVVLAKLFAQKVRLLSLEFLSPEQVRAIRPDRHRHRFLAQSPRTRVPV